MSLADTVDLDVAGVAFADVEELFRHGVFDVFHEERAERACTEEGVKAILHKVVTALLAERYRDFGFIRLWILTHDRADAAFGFRDLKPRIAFRAIGGQDDLPGHGHAFAEIAHELVEDVGLLRHAQGTEDEGPSHTSEEFGG